MSKAKKQTTLFQSWAPAAGVGISSQGAPSLVQTAGASIKSDTGYGLPTKKYQKPTSDAKLNFTAPICLQRKQGTSISNDGSDDDEELLRALEESLKTFQAETCLSEQIQEDKIEGKVDVIDAQNAGYSGTAVALPPGLPENYNIKEVPPGFDVDAGRIWIYPTNRPIRSYQFDIVKKALFENTMVTLPTGLGKTFIAAVIMFNFYRWYPTGKVVFMAPTKPLVAQQIEACHNIMGIPMNDTAEMTGAMKPMERRRAWKLKQVFFLTPQVMANDLCRGICPADDVRCIIVDEAHKATGNHAYCQVIRELLKYTQQFRVVALSATPGSDMKSVQQVLSNLLIANVALRNEESIDIQPYTHKRRIDKIVVPLGEDIIAVRDQYLRVASVTIQRLQRQRALFGPTNPQSITKFTLLQARDMYRRNPPQGGNRAPNGAVEGDFALAVSLYHGYELLQVHGMRSLYSYLDGLVSGSKGGCGRVRAELLRNSDFTELFDKLKENFQLIKHANPNIVQSTQRGASQLNPVPSIGHPKMSKLEEIVVEHFNMFEAEGRGETRIIIFSQYRDSCNEITEILSRHRPLVRVMSFIGQSAGTTTGAATSVGKSKGFSQKDQLAVMKQFREGGYNTLVSTCVGEEGLDIGEVDLIICFDAHKNPVRQIQRMGRTGRKRQGRIVMLIAEGKEEQIYNSCQLKTKSIHHAMLASTASKSLTYYDQNPRMVPSFLQPMCHRMAVIVPEYQAQSKTRLTSASPMLHSNSMSEAPSKGRNTSNKEGCYLSIAELSYWSEHFKIENEADVPEVKITSPQMLSLSKNKSVHTFKDLNSGTCQSFSAAVDELPGKCPKRTLSVEEWLPWQNRLQDTHVLEHSLETRNLVELIQFIDLQKSTTEDVYGLEMEKYLDLSDVVQSADIASVRPVPLVEPVSNNNITKYCTKFDSQLRSNSEALDENSSCKHVSDAVTIFSDASVDVPLSASTEPISLINKPLANKRCMHVTKFLPESSDAKTNQNNFVNDSDGDDFEADGAKIINATVLQNEDDMACAGVDPSEEHSISILKNGIRSTSHEAELFGQCISDIVCEISDQKDGIHNESSLSREILLKETSLEFYCDNLFAYLDIQDDIMTETTRCQQKCLLNETPSPIRVRTPPSIKNAILLMNHLESSEHICLVDVHCLMKEWEREQKQDCVNWFFSKLDKIMNNTTVAETKNFEFQSSEREARHISVVHIENETVHAQEADMMNPFAAYNADSIPHLHFSPDVSENIDDGNDLRILSNQRLRSTPKSALKQLPHNSHYEYNILNRPDSPKLIESCEKSVKADSTVKLLVTSADSIAISSPLATEQNTGLIRETAHPSLTNSVVLFDDSCCQIVAQQHTASNNLPNNEDTIKRELNQSPLHDNIDIGPRFDLGFDFDDDDFNDSYNNRQCDADGESGVSSDDDDDVIPPSQTSLLLSSRSKIVPSLSRPDLTTSAATTGLTIDTCEIVLPKDLPTALFSVQQPTTNAVVSKDASSVFQPQAVVNFNLDLSGLDFDDDIIADDCVDANRQSAEKEMCNVSISCGGKEDVIVIPDVESSQCVVQEISNAADTKLSICMAGNSAGSINSCMEPVEERDVVLVEDDESLVQVKRKTSYQPVALMSPESPALMARCPTVNDNAVFKSPMLCSLTSRKRPNINHTSSDSDSPLVAKTGKFKRRVLDDDVDDDFKDFTTIKRKISNRISDKASITTAAKDVKLLINRCDKLQDRGRREASSSKGQSHGKKRHLIARQFIDTEAEVSSDDESEDDEDGSDLDQMDASFINDSSQCTQALAAAEDSVCVQAFYLQSIRSPLLNGASGKYRLKPRAAAIVDVFSQPVDEDEYDDEDDDDEYEEDSFCVGDGEASADDQALGHNLSLDEDVTICEERIIERRIRRSKSKIVSRGKKSNLISGNGRRRIVEQADSSTDEASRLDLDIQIAARASNKVELSSKKSSACQKDQLLNDINNFDLDFDCLSSPSPPRQISEQPSCNSKQGIDEDGWLNKNDRSSGHKSSALKRNSFDVVQRDKARNSLQWVSENNILAPNKDIVYESAIDASHRKDIKVDPDIPVFSLGMDDILGEFNEDDGVLDMYRMLLTKPSSHSERSKTSVEKIAAEPEVSEVFRKSISKAEINRDASGVSSGAIKNLNCAVSELSGSNIHPCVSGSMRSSQASAGIGVLVTGGSSSSAGRLKSTSAVISTTSTPLLSNNTRDPFHTSTIRHLPSSSSSVLSRSKSFDISLPSCNKSYTYSQSNNANSSSVISSVVAPSSTTTFIIPTDFAAKLSDLNSSTVSSCSEEERIRGERIRLSRLKREEFRNKFGQNIPVVLSQPNPDPQTCISTTCPKKSIIIQDDGKETNESIVKNSSLTLDSERAVFSSSLLSKPCAPIVHSGPAVIQALPSSGDSPSGMLKILVDSRQLSQCQAIISSLRFKHKVEVAIRSLNCCCFIVSNRVAIERKLQSDFTNGSKKAKLVERIQQMCSQFDRPCLIVERDTSSKQCDADLNVLRNHHVQNTVACLAQTHIKLLFSDSQEDSADIIFELCRQEGLKKFAISHELNLTSTQEQAYKFYSSLPQVNEITALNLLYGFTKIGDFINSTSAQIESQCCITRERSERIHRHIRHQFHPQMISMNNISKIAK